MNFLWKNFLSKAKITEEMLTKNNIPLLELSKLTINLNYLITTSGFGKFYNGTYDNKKVTIKIVNILIDESILNEFILWKSYQNNPNFLNLKGVIIYYNDAYIIFSDYFQYSLSTAINKRILTYEKKINITKKILSILISLKKEKKLVMDLRPGTFSLDSNFNVKLIDFGMVVNMQNLQNETELRNIRIKYSPPEYILNNIMDQSYDIYSFGCILIDIFSEKLNMIPLNNFLNYDMYLTKIKNGNYLKIPKEINCLLYGVISRILTDNCENRIKIDELKNNMDAILNESNLNINDDLNKLNEEEKIEFEDNELIDIYNFASEINTKTINVFNNVNTELQENIQTLKNNLLKNYEDTLNNLEVGYKLIKDKLEIIYKNNKKLTEEYYQKILENILQMQTSLSITMNDLLDIQNQVNGIKIDINAFNKFINKDKYENIYKSFNTTQNDIKKTIKKHSSKEDFDIMNISYNSNYNLVNNYINHNNKLITDLKNVFENMNSLSALNDDGEKFEELLKNDIITQKAINNVINNEEENNLDIEENKEKEDKNNENKEEIDPLLIVSMTENIYAKIIEDTQLIIIFNYFTKKISNYNVLNNLIDNEEDINNNKFIKFNCNSFSLYDKKNNCIYISGGLSDFENHNSHSNNLLKINIIYVQNNENINQIGNYKFEIINLCPMQNPRSNHSMMQLSTNNNILVCLGGINTNTCEVYNIKFNEWASIQDLPYSCVNSAVIDFNDCIFVFWTTAQFDFVYKLNMNKANENLIWEKINFDIGYNIRLKKGMGIINIGDYIYLFGGIDHENNEYDDVFDVNFDNGDIISIEKIEGINLPNKCHFNSNIIKNKNNENLIIMLNNDNEILEFDYENKIFTSYKGGG